MIRNGEACRLYRRPSDYSLRHVPSPSHHKCADNDCCVSRPLSRAQTIILLQLWCHERQLAGKTVFADAYRYSRTRSNRYLVSLKMTNARSLIVVWRSPHNINIGKQFGCARKFSLPTGILVSRSSLERSRGHCNG